MANTEPTLSSVASSAILRHNEDKDIVDKPYLDIGSGINRLKRGLLRLTKEGASEFHVLYIGTIDLI